MAVPKKLTGNVAKNGDGSLSHKLDHLRYLHSVAERYKDSIYSRSQLLLAITGAQLAATIAIANHAMATSGIPPTPIWFRVLILTAITMQLVAGVIVLKTIMPLGGLRSVRRIIARGTDYSASSGSVWLMSSFNHVCLKEREDFKKIVDESTLREMFDDLSITYYNLCHIVNTRYNSLRRGTLLQMCGFLALLLEAVAAFLVL